MIHCARRGRTQMVAVLVKTDRLELRAPFHNALPYRSKFLGDRWTRAEVGWVFELVHEEAVRGLCFDLFGVDGREGLRDTVNLEVTVDEHVMQRTVFVAYGQPIAFARSGDRSAPAATKRRPARPRREVCEGATVVPAFRRELPAVHRERLRVHRDGSAAGHARTVYGSHRRCRGGSRSLIEAVLSPAGARAACANGRF